MAAFRFPFFWKLSTPTRARVMHWGFNLFPAFRGAGGRLLWVSPDFLSMRARLKFNWRTRNIMGSVYGGSMFAVTDGPHPIMLMSALGPDYVVWDKSAQIQYRRPAYEDLYVDFSFTADEVAEIKCKLDTQPELDHTVHMQLIDLYGEVHARVQRTLYVAHRSYVEEKRRARHSTGSAGPAGK
jgi:acyl-coenzyme A thioesterase PaaI-like protein